MNTLVIALCLSGGPPAAKLAGNPYLLRAVWTKQDSRMLRFQCEATRAVLADPKDGVDPKLLRHRLNGLDRIAQGVAVPPPEEFALLRKRIAELEARLLVVEPK